MLTDAQCRAAKPREGIYRLNDYKGLYLEIKPNGIKAWRYRFKLNDKASWFALGDYPSVTLGEAREKCEAARKLVKEGINPVQNRQIERIKREQDSANTFEAIAKEWLALKDWEEVTKKRRLDMLERVVFPSIGKLPVRQITPAHVLDILNKTVKRGAPTVAAEAKRTMSGVFEHAVATLRADTDPVWPVRKALPPNKTQHKRALSAEEVGQLLNDFDGHGGNFQTIKAFQLMWLTLSRPNESVQAEWAEFDLEKALWTIPARRMKARREHVVPLPTQAVELLKAMHPITGHTKFVFPNRDDRQRPTAREDDRPSEAGSGRGCGSEGQDHRQGAGGQVHRQGREPSREDGGERNHHPRARERAAQRPPQEDAQPRRVRAVGPLAVGGDSARRAGRRPATRRRAAADVDEREGQ